MKNILFAFILISVLGSCDSDDNRQRNPNLLNVNVNFVVRLSLPQNNALNFPNNPVLYPQYGNGGVVVMNTGGTFVAWDAADPNHPPNSSCRIMNLEGLTLTCDCEDNTYDVFTGNFVEGEDLEYTLLRYRVAEEQNGDLRVTN